MVMMAVMIGIIIQIRDDGLLSPSSMFFLAVSGQVIITGEIRFLLKCDDSHFLWRTFFKIIQFCDFLFAN